MKRNDASPQAYIDSTEEPQRALLLRVRALVLEVCPNANEYIEYGMLAYSDVANLAAQKNYVSLYVAPKALDEWKNKHPGQSCGKSCLRFANAKKLDDLGDESIRELIRSVLALPPEERSC